MYAGVEPDPTTGAIMTPVYLTSTYVQDGTIKGLNTSDAQLNLISWRRRLPRLNTAPMAWPLLALRLDTVPGDLQPGDEVISTNDLRKLSPFTTVFANYITLTRGFGRPRHFVGH